MVYWGCPRIYKCNCYFLLPFTKVGYIITISKRLWLQVSSCGTITVLTLPEPLGRVLQWNKKQQEGAEKIAKEFTAQTEDDDYQLDSVQKQMGKVGKKVQRNWKFKKTVEKQLLACSLVSNLSSGALSMWVEETFYTKMKRGCNWGY